MYILYNLVRQCAVLQFQSTRHLDYCNAVSWVLLQCNVRLITQGAFNISHVISSNLISSRFIRTECAVKRPGSSWLRPIKTRTTRDLLRSDWSQPRRTAGSLHSSDETRSDEMRLAISTLLRIRRNHAAPHRDNSRHATSTCAAVSSAHHPQRCADDVRPSVCPSVCLFVCLHARLTTRILKLRVIVPAVNDSLGLSTNK